MPDETTFEAAFLSAQSALGLQHYHVTFKPDASPDNYAELDAEPEDCIATVRFNQSKLAADNVLESTATHEAIHLLLRDLVHALETNPRAARAEEERIVRRLEYIVYEALFGLCN